jgi:hypothetical protein
MKTFSIGDTLIDIADFLDTRIEDDTLVAFFPHSDFANARFTIVTVKKDGKEVDKAGENIVRQRAEKLGAELYQEKNFVWYYTSESASEGSPGSLMHYWYIGMGGHVIIASCFIDSAYKDSSDAKRVLDSMLLSIKSIRRK